ERHGRPDEAAAYRERGVAHLERLGAEADEREGLRHDDTLLPPDTTSDLIPIVLAELRPLKEVKRAFLVRKQLEVNPDSSPVHILFVIRAGRTLRLDRENAA